MTVSGDVASFTAIKTEFIVEAVFAFFWGEFSSRFGLGLRLEHIDLGILVFFGSGISYTGSGIATARFVSIGGFEHVVRCIKFFGFLSHICNGGWHGGQS